MRRRASERAERQRHGAGERHGGGLVFAHGTNRHVVSFPVRPFAVLCAGFRRTPSVWITFACTAIPCRLRGGRCPLIPAVSPKGTRSDPPRDFSPIRRLRHTIPRIFVQIPTSSRIFCPSTSIHLPGRRIHRLWNLTESASEPISDNLDWIAANVKSSPATLRCASRSNSPSSSTGMVTASSLSLFWNSFASYM